MGQSQVQFSTWVLSSLNQRTALMRGKAGMAWVNVSMIQAALLSPTAAWADVGSDDAVSAIMSGFALSVVMAWYEPVKIWEKVCQPFWGLL